MAKRTARAQAVQPAVRPRAKTGAGTIFIVSILVLILIIITLPTWMIIGFGMLPSVVAWVVDRSEQKYSTICVGGMNFCGVFPSLLTLWSKGHSIERATEILTNVYTLVIIFGAAGIGWLLFMSIPPVVAAFLNVVAQHRIAALRGTQRRIVEEWGESVAKPPEGGPVKSKPKAAAPAPAKRGK